MTHKEYKQKTSQKRDIMNEYHSKRVAQHTVRAELDNENEELKKYIKTGDQGGIEFYKKRLERNTRDKLPIATKQKLRAIQIALEKDYIKRNQIEY